MTRALYGPEGFFTQGGGAGRRADFLTSPEVGPLFGAVVARALDHHWDELDRPRELAFVDAGAGRATLCRSVRAAEPRCAAALRYIAVETSDVLRAEYPEWISAHASLPASLGCGVIVANELLDNLPFDLASDDGPVTVRGGRFSSPPAVAIQRAAHDFVARARSAIDAGAVIAIDYCTTTAAMRERPWTEWLRTYRAHGRGTHPLESPGTQDITCEVAVDQLPQPDEHVTQADWLRRYGIDDLVLEARAALAGRVAATDLRTLRLRSRLREVEALTDPAGLGAFGVLTWRP